MYMYILHTCIDIHKYIYIYTHMYIFTFLDLGMNFEMLEMLVI